MPINPLKIAVIGAGISGLACATHLKNIGFDVTVLKKSRGPSGQLSTRIADYWQCDHGAQYFTASDADFYQEVQRWKNAGVADIWTPRLQETDGHLFFSKISSTQRYIGVLSNTAPAKFLARSLSLLTDHTVTHLEKNASGWKVSTQERGELSVVFDIMILSMPSHQAAVLLQMPSPSLARIAESIKMRGCWALMCRYKHTLELAFDGLFINQKILSWAARDSTKPGRVNMKNHEHIENKPVETWILQANSVWSEAHIDDEADEVANAMIQTFIQLGGEKPAEYTIHRWRYAECVSYLDTGFAWDEDNKIGLCGDWLNQGKVQGAWLSGHQLAKK